MLTYACCAFIYKMLTTFVKVYPGFLTISFAFLMQINHASGKVAIKPADDVDDLTEKFNNVNLERVDVQGPPCLLDIQKDFPDVNEPQPLYLVPGTTQFWLPNERGLLSIPRGATIELHCSKGFSNATKQYNESNGLKMLQNSRTICLSCLQDKIFLWQGEKHELRQFVCTEHIRYKVERTNEPCGMMPATGMTNAAMSSSAREYRVGFSATHKGRFLETMRICYDEALLRTYYVQHTLSPAILHMQKFVKRLSFSKAGYFDDLDINYFYKRKNQHERVALLLKGEHLEYLFDNKSLYLVRGHLAAKADYLYATQQHSTFHYFNVAPQWQSFNAGQWATLEYNVRGFVARSHLQVDCYTGTWGILQLPIVRETQAIQWQDFYLGVDKNNNEILPVPKLFFRIILDSSHPNRGIALIGVNNPHAGIREIEESYVVCRDIREKVPWLRWMRNENVRKGYLYACRVSELAEAVQHLPHNLTNVTEILQ
ncbi:uncharacterized protein ACN427_004106 [Glossina fuscipes fuscipes]